MVGCAISMEEKIREFLREDIGYGDLTSAALVDDGQRARARVFFREDGVAAGLEEAAAAFALLGCTVELLEEDGGRVAAGAVVMEIRGPAGAILSGRSGIRRGRWWPRSTNAPSRRRRGIRRSMLSFSCQDGVYDLSAVF